MRTLLKILTLLSILSSFYMVIPAYVAFQSITKDPEGWMGGLSPETTIIWFAIIVLGFGFLTFVSVLALFGWLFGSNKRAAGFWLFKLPGILGIALTALLAITVFLWDIDWQNHLYITLLLFVPFLIYTIYGSYIRRTIPKKTKTL